MGFVYFQLGAKSGPLKGPEDQADTAAHLIPVTFETPEQPETPPSPWLEFKDSGTLTLLDLGQQAGREAFAEVMSDVPLYRITLELLVDRILLEARHDIVRTKGVQQAFHPEEPPEPVADIMSEKYAFSGTLHFPVIASRTDAQLIDLYLRLFGAATPDHKTPQDHLAAMLGGYPARLSEQCDGFMWRGTGWARLDRLIYEAMRFDHDPDITFESYVTRGRAAAEALAVDDPEALLAAWLAAERVQKELCRDIDAALRLPDIRRLPRFVRADVFRVLEREAMKQVFAEHITKTFSEWPGLRRSRILSDPIAANARGEVAPLIQQLLNQTLSADARYAGAGDAFALAAERRYAEAKSLIGQ